MEFSLSTRDLLQRVWNWVPGKNAWEKLSLVFAVLGVLVAVPSTVDWVQQKWNGIDRDKQIEQLTTNVQKLAQSARERSTQAAGKPNDGQLKSGLEKDIGAAIETLAEGGKKEALAALERGDTKAAEAVLAEKIDQLDKARTGSAQKEAALYRQRGALAYLNDTQAALRDYAKAAELDPDDGEGLYFLGQLQARAGDRPAAKQSFERLIALGDRVSDEKQRHWAYFLLGDVEADLGNRDAALNHYKRGQALVQALIKRDPNNAEWQRDLSVSYNKIGDISAARGDRDAALKAYQDGLDIAKQLAARDPNNALNSI